MFSFGFARYDVGLMAAGLILNLRGMGQSVWRILEVWRGK